MNGLCKWNGPGCEAAGTLMLMLGVWTNALPLGSDADAPDTNQSTLQWRPRLHWRQ